MKNFFWSAGHIGWFFFTIVVFSVLCLLAIDIVWRVRPTSLRKEISIAVLVWAAGVAVLIAWWYVQFGYA